MPSLRRRKATGEKESREDLGGQMSFLDHLDELRKRLIRCMVFVLLTAMGCWFLSDRIYNFLARPVQNALAEAQQRRVAASGLNGQQASVPLNSLHQNDKLRFVFPETTRLGSVVIPAGASVTARVDKDNQDKLGLFTDEPLSAGNEVVPKDARLPVDFNAAPADKLPDLNDKLVVTTALEPFALYVKVSLYAALAVSVPFLLWQIWAFISPGLYPHERKYVTPFIAFSSIGFIAGAATAYRLIFPPAARYLLGLGQDFRLLLKADDYFDFIILLMLGMGVVFQMPAITYVLSRIGLITAGWMLRVWRTAVIVILIAAAVLSPTNDVPNMLLFAAPMFVLYAVSILVAWIFGRERRAI
ncbi:MAG TPA: twin-arginine translocase subunit TatC [Pyrinomonadaceae bacterium]|nr:twin-arginine translocase subunit TatC [Pyrinomonadaceae bacterium]